MAGPARSVETLSDPWRRRSPSASQGLVSRSRRSSLGLGLVGLGLVNIRAVITDLEERPDDRPTVSLSDLSDLSSDTVVVFVDPSTDVINEEALITCIGL